MKTFLLIIVLFVTTSLYSTIINVPANQPTIQEGIVAAANNDTVLVADGTYFENIDFIGKAITVASNFIIDGNEAHIENTIINGSQPEDPDFGSCVMFLSGEDNNSVFTGFYLTEGTGCLSLPLNANTGGGIYCEGSSPKIISNIVMDNTSEYIGGIGIKHNSLPIVLNNIISNNNATFNNGGVGIAQNSSPHLEGNIILDNTANNYSGGVLIYSGCSPTLLDNIICFNTAGLDGGGIEIDGSTPVITNCTIYDNEASGGGSQIDCWSGGATVVNCIIGGNTANESVYFGTSSATFDYCDFYNTDGLDFNGNVPSGLGVITTVNNNVDPCDEFMNILLDPLFVDSDIPDYHLSEDSPCIDAGDDEFPLDPDGTYIEIGRFYFEQVGIEDNTIVQEKDYLQQNYPNPFNPTTTINYSLKENSKVSLDIYNIKGQKVKQLISDHLSAGHHSIVWNGKDDKGKTVSSGIYFYKLKTENFEKTKKMILLK